MSWIPQGALCQMKICSVLIYGISAPKLDWHLPKLGRMYCNPEKIGRKNALVLPQSLGLHALNSPDRIWGLFWLRAMCMAMNIFGLVLSNAGIPWIMALSCWSPRTSGGHISCNIAHKTTAQTVMLFLMYNSEEFSVLRYFLSAHLAQQPLHSVLTDFACFQTLRSTYRP